MIQFTDIPCFPDLLLILIQRQHNNGHLFGKELFIRFTVHVFRERLSICVCPSFPFGFEGGMWDVLIPDHCLSIYFLYKLYGTYDILRLKAFSETSTYYFFPFDGGQVLWSLV